MLRLILVDDALVPSARKCGIFTQVKDSTGIALVPVEYRVSPTSVHPLDVAEDLAECAYKAACEASALFINMNLVINGSGSLSIRRQDRIGVTVTEALRRRPSFLLPVYGYSFESAAVLSRCEPFRILFVDFAKCNRFFRLPFSKGDFTLQRPSGQDLKALAEALQVKKDKSRSAEAASAIRDLLSCFGHNRGTDLVALVGPVKAALRVGCYDLATQPEKMEVVRFSLGQLKAEANSLTVDPFVRRAVLSEIERLQLLWDGSIEAIDRIYSSSGSPEKELVFHLHEALEMINAFEKRILELLRG